MSGCRNSALSSTVNLESSAADLAVGGDDQRVDLDQHRVGLAEGAVGARSMMRRRLARSSAGMPAAKQQLARDERLEADAADRCAGARARSGVVAATSSMSTPPAVVSMKSGPLGAAVERDREVVLALDVGRALDPERRDGGRGCRGRGSPRACCSASAGSAASLMPPALPRPPMSTCALTTTGPASCSAAASRLVRGVGDDRPPRRDAEAREQLLALVLVEIHRRGSVEGRAVSGVRNHPEATCYRDVGLTYR